MSQNLDLRIAVNFLLACLMIAAALLLCGCSAVIPDMSGQAAVVAMLAKQEAIDTKPEPEVCPGCENGYVRHGDGHKTICPCGGPGKCKCNDGDAGEFNDTTKPNPLPPSVPAAKTPQKAARQRQPARGGGILRRGGLFRGGGLFCVGSS